jgi:hypothetical protein
MADLSDVTALLAQSAAAAVYPNGTGQPSVVNALVNVFEGWPEAQSLDATLAAGGAQVSVYPQMAGSSSTTAQYLDAQDTIIAPVLGLTVQVEDYEVVVSGAPAQGEFLTVIIDGNQSFTGAGSTLTAILSALLVAVAPMFPQAFVSGSTITFPHVASLQARSGALGTAGRITHRQKQNVMVTVWAPNAAMRSALSAAIDVAITAVIRVTFPDTSQGIVRYLTTHTSDERVSDLIYRRDLIFEVEYATVQTYPVTAITATDFVLEQIAPGS